MLNVWVTAAVVVLGVGALGVVALSAVRDRRTARVAMKRCREMELGRQEADLLLRELIDSREHHRATLEEKVRERTGELQKAYEELKKVDELKDSFLSSVSHELRTPLSSIRSFSEILLAYDTDAQTRREFLEIVNRESERLTRLINDVLDLARIESGEMPWTLEAGSLAEISEKAAAPLSVLVLEKGQSLMTDVPADLPMALVDRDRLIQVLENLISNAVKFTGEGGTIRLTGELVSAGPGSTAMIRMTIADDGIGIPRDQINSIFEKFKQVGDTLTSKPTGTGLGLPISREIIAKLGGTLWAESDPGEGSRFIFTLPIAQRLERPAPPPAPIAHVPAHRPAADERPRALVVGAEPVIRGLLRAELRELGFDAAEAVGSRDAIEQCTAAPPGLILLDVPSPGHEAVDTLRTFRETTDLAAVPVLVVSETFDRESALAAGATGHLCRPVDPVLLRERVASMLAPRKQWVAVADDDMGTVGLLSELLGLRGYGVLKAYDGDEAVRLARENEIDLMILDLNMPRRSGWKVLEALRGDPRTSTLPVIVLTGMEAEMDRARALALGAVEFLEKGHGLERLTAEIDLCVQRRL